MSQATSVAIALLLLAAPAGAGDDDRGRRLVEEMVRAVGPWSELRELRDVQYTYTFRDADGKADVSVERYLFDGELSWAQYSERQNNVLPDRPGTVVQGFDGSTSWMTIDGERITDPQAVKLADFLRKTNFYWFAMMPKLLDPGVRHTYEGDREVGAQTYHVVKVGFEPGTGDVQDTYVLFIHPETKLVDRFLFTVLDFGISDPLLMTVEYEEHHGLKLPARRKYAPATWDGTVKQPAEWTDEIMTDIRFNNGFDAASFQPPG